MTKLQSRLFKSVFILFYLLAMTTCLVIAVFAFPAAKIAAACFFIAAIAMYGLAKIVNTQWDTWFKQKETS